MKSNILFLLHLPPPVHGSSMVGKFINTSEKINQQFNCDYINLLASNNVSETGKVSIKKITGFVYTWFTLLFKLIKKRPTLCYIAITATGTAFFKDVLLIILLKVFKIKCVFHMHNKGVSKFQNNTIYNSCYAFVFKNAEVILLSKFLYADIRKYVAEENIHICPNGIPHIKYGNVQNSENEVVKILFLSNLIESKGVFVLLEACKVLKEKGVPFECLFIGGEGDINNVQFNQKVKDLELVKEVSFIGKKYGEEKRNYFSKATIFAFPTYYSNECFPLVLLEAMQAKLPVISTFEGGIPDIVENQVSGFLVEQENIEALANKIEILICDKELRKEMGSNGKIKYETEFTLEIFEKRLSTILLNVIENSEKC